MTKSLHGRIGYARGVVAPPAVWVLRMSPTLHDLREFRPRAAVLQLRLPGGRAARTTKPGQPAISEGSGRTGGTPELPTAIPGAVSSASRDRSPWGFALHAGRGNIPGPVRLRGLRCQGAVGRYYTEPTRRMAEAAPIKEVCADTPHSEAGIGQEGPIRDFCTRSQAFVRIDGTAGNIAEDLFTAGLLESIFLQVQILLRRGNPCIAADAHTHPPCLTTQAEPVVLRL